MRRRTAGARHPDRVSRRRGPHHAAARRAGRAARAGGRGHDARRGRAARDASGGARGDPLRQARRATGAAAASRRWARSSGARRYARRLPAASLAGGRPRWRCRRRAFRAHRLRRQPGGDRSTPGASRVRATGHEVERLLALAGAPRPRTQPPQVVARAHRRRPRGRRRVARASAASAAGVRGAGARDRSGAPSAGPAIPSSRPRSSGRSWWSAARTTRRWPTQVVAAAPGRALQRGGRARAPRRRRR